MGVPLKKKRKATKKYYNHNRKPNGRFKLSLIIFSGLALLSVSLYLYFSSYGDGSVEVGLIDGISTENQDRIKIESEIRKITAGYPIDQMVPFILEKDPKVAAFLVSIAKKESNLGKRSPVLDGQDCYNYWGFRAQRERMGSGGHTCFDSPEDAVDTVATRLENLIQSDHDTPREMVVWKCGSSCSGHSPVSVQKWISDVNLFFKKLYSP